jgi:hypothetical protein
LLWQSAKVRFPRPKIGKLAWQAQGVGIFAHRANTLSGRYSSPFGELFCLAGVLYEARFVR